ncbi:exu family protein [Megaselia abdita]
MESPVLPPGKYTLVGIDVDTTGRRLIDEIVQLAAFTPNSQYGQYIMPYMNLNPAARQRHQVRVITVGFYRLLKCSQTYKVVKSKSEYAALKEFLDWVEKIYSADKDSNGVIFIYHEERKFIPYMLLEAMKKYDLLERFFNTAKSFANGYEFAEQKYGSTMKNVSLRQLSKMMFNNTENMNGVVQEDLNNNTETSQKTAIPDPNLFEGSATVRARLAYEIAMNLAKQECQEPSVDKLQDYMLKIVNQYAHPVQVELDELQRESKNLERQNSFRPVFLQYFKTTLYHRVKAVKFRIVLAENCHDLNSLSTIWNEKRKEGLAEVIQNVPDLKAEEKTELVDLFDSYFDPAKATIKPIVKRNRRRNRRNRNKEIRPHTSSNQGAGGDKQPNPLPDSTTRTPNRKMSGDRLKTEKMPISPPLVTATALPNISNM